MIAEHLHRTYQKVKKKLKVCIAVHGKTHRRATERHLPYEITQCYLPPDTGKCAPS